MSDELLSEIRAFLAETGMGPSYFGRVATGNSELVARLQAGGTVTLTTAQAVRDFIAARRGENRRSKSQSAADTPAA